MKKLSLSALVAAGLMAGALTTGANAADLGGNCCADLEERIAELEATTARKGNRKVSLTISGFVAQQIMFWDDGHESEHLHPGHGLGLDRLALQVRWSGNHRSGLDRWLRDQHRSDLERLAAAHPERRRSPVLGAGSNNAQAVVSGNGTGPLAVESSYWFVKSDHYGRVSLGTQSSAADNQAILPDGSGSLVVANYVMYDHNGFLLRRSDRIGQRLAGRSRPRHLADCAALNAAGGAAGDCDGFPDTNIRYDSPTFAGFLGVGIVG